jgi:hypothetical protein
MVREVKLVILGKLVLQARLETLDLLVTRELQEERVNPALAGNLDRLVQMVPQVPLVTQDLWVIQAPEVR